MAINYIIQALLFPPASLLLLILIGLLLLKGRPGLGKAVIYSAVLLGYLLSISAVSDPLSQQLHVYPALTKAQVQATQAKAIVILGGGREFKAPEYGDRDTVSHSTLVRLRYGAYLARETGLPLLTTGGRVFVDDNSPAEAALMADALKNEWGVATKWQESRSRNTYENAELTHQLLKPLGIEHILLVTHGSHMLRSVEAFEHQGFTVTPAPTKVAHDKPNQAPGILDWIPKAGALKVTNNVLHETIGRLWYHIRYY